MAAPSTHRSPSAASGLVEACKGVPDSLRSLCGVIVARVLGPRPEEPAQPVLADPRDDVDVEMRDRLADDVVVADESALGAHRFGDRAGGEVEGWGGRG